MSSSPLSLKLVEAEMRLIATSVSVFLAIASVAGAGSVSGATTAQSAACAAQADHQSLTGENRQAFVAKCMKGPMAPDKPSMPTRPGSGAQSVVSPSGHDRVTRSQQCTAEADRRGLKEHERAAFRLSCLATAAPVKAVGTSTTPPRPTPAKANLGVQTPSGQH
jgi:hypothetical protein